ncbi:hypothetical protein Glove_167g52 [Diversispora epigaea]|uniref:Uncharacterized protein n=1 Tax=Diversispora epigaea TaxID=1348612 RepID=A0A397IUX7_9GLOM|nr:hypothetical protein Glove_167g52 [Diversispora epigaea]
MFSLSLEPQGTHGMRKSRTSKKKTNLHKRRKTSSTLINNHLYKFQVPTRCQMLRFLGIGESFGFLAKISLLLLFCLFLFLFLFFLLIFVTNIEICKFV